MIDYIIAGERRSGTTFLYNLIKLQKHCAVHSKADFGYFTDESVKSQKDQESDWGQCHSLDDLDRKLDFTNRSPLKGLKDADFLFWKASHQRAFNWLPKLKLILVLRNPVKRAFSHYINEVIKGREVESFERAIELEEERSETSDFAKFHLSYVSRGYYDRSLSKLYQTYDPSQVLIILDHQLYSDPEGQIERVSKFLGFEPSPIDASLVLKNRNFILELKPKFRGDSWSKWIKQYDNWSESLVTRLTKDRDKRNAYRSKIKGVFFQEKQFVLTQTTQERLKLAYKESLSRLDDILGIKTGWY